MNLRVREIINRDKGRDKEIGFPFSRLTQSLLSVNHFFIILVNLYPVYNSWNQNKIL